MFSSCAASSAIIEIQDGAYVVLESYRISGDINSGLRVEITVKSLYSD